MKNNILIIFFVIFYYSLAVIAENLKIQARNITLDKNDENSIFENNVIIQTLKEIEYLVITQNIIKKSNLLY